MPDFRRGVFKAAAASGPFEPGLLPDAEKERLCRELLAEFGVTSIRVTHDGEMIHSCCLPTGGHTNGDASPSASLNYKKLTYNCVAAETRVKTFDGEFPIKDLAGTTQMVLDGNGRWVQAPIRAYGVQRLSKITLSRNGVRKEVYATADHRWLVRPRGNYRAGDLVETTTAQLRPRQRIPSVWAMTRTGRTTISPVGVMAGFVYGDGSATEHGARANFCGEKDRHLLPYFAGHRVVGSDAMSQVVAGLPRSWKTRLPDLDEGPSYLYGWLAGYFAADGCVADDGHITLSCASREVLERVVTICDRLGIAAYTLTSRARSGYAGESEVSTLSLRASTLIPEFFLVPEHRRCFEEAAQKRKYERTHWWVVSVEETDRVEEVYCAEVPTTQSFVLEGNILTGNCLGCGSSGGLLWFIALCRGEDTDFARSWLADQTGTGPDEQSLASLLEFFDAVYAAPSRPQVAPIPKMSKAVLKPWRLIHPYLTDSRDEGGRGIPEETIVHFEVGYAEAYKVRFKAPAGDPRADAEGMVSIESPRIVIPHFWKGDLVGWQTRRLVKDGSAKYLSSPDFPKDTTLYNYDARRRTAVVVESPMSVLARYHHVPHMEATFGAKMTDRQLSLISMHPRVILWLDPDDAGWKATKRAGDYLVDYCDVWVVDSPWNADAADLDDEEAAGLLEHSLVPYSLWKPPTTLFCWTCKQEAHEGVCAA